MELIKELAKLLDSNYSKALDCKDRIRRAHNLRLGENACEQEFEEFFEKMFFQSFKIEKQGPLGEKNEVGSGKPKTWEFYFTKYCCNRINFIACERRSRIRKT